MSCCQQALTECRSGKSKGMESEGKGWSRYVFIDIALNNLMFLQAVYMFLMKKSHHFAVPHTNNISKVVGRYTMLHKLFSCCSCEVIWASFIACFSL